MGATRGTLDIRGSDLAELVQLTQVSLEEASTALFEHDPELYISLEAFENELRDVRDRIEDHASALLAVSDLSGDIDVRTVVLQVQINANVEAMADLIQQMANIARSRSQRSEMPEPLVTILRRMSRLCMTALKSAADALETKSTPDISTLSNARSDVSHSQCQLLRECGKTELRVAIDATLTGRLYEQVAEHTVSIAHQTRLLIEAPQG